MQNMDIAERWFLFSTLPRFGPIKQAKLLAKVNSIDDIFANDTRTKLDEFLTTEQKIHLKDIKSEKLQHFKAWLDKPNHHVISIQDANYPALLKETPDPPLVLYAIGNTELLKSVQIAVVGSRNPSTSGRRLAQDFAAGLSQFGFSITSGLALGIDAAAHTGCLKAQGITIAVLGHGLDSIYPARHKRLAQEISETGLLLSEYPPGVKPLKHHFPQRNRLISGMSVGVLVVEAARQSGSLITARLAMEQGREVFAIPGAINNPLTKGGHSLIKQGAKLVEDVNDIIEDLKPLCSVALDHISKSETVEETTESLADEHEKMLSAMGFEPIDVDQLCDRTALTPDVVSSMLLQLELNGRVEQRHGGCYLRLL